MIKKENRLPARGVGRVLSKGRSFSTANLSCRFIPNKPQSPLKITVVVGKKVAQKAVLRNYIKRKTREAFDGLIGSISGVSVVVFPKKTVEEIDFENLKQEAAECLKKSQFS